MFGWLAQWRDQRIARANLRRERNALALQLRAMQEALAEARRPVTELLAAGRTQLALAETARQRADIERDAALGRLAQIERVTADYHLVGAGLGDADLAAIRACLALLSPVACAHPMKRYGQDGDGGYVIADIHDSPRRAVALGVGIEISFDRDLLGIGYEVHQFDHSVEARPFTHPDLHFNKVRVVGADPGPGETTLEAIAAALAPAGAPGLLLKCDIADSEWDVLSPVRIETLARFSQIVIELHWLNRLHDPHWLPMARACMQKLAAGHAPIHVHGNNWGLLVSNGSFTYPDVLEVTFLRRDLLGAPPRLSRRVFPTALDRRNNPDKPELFLGSFAWDD